MKFQLGTHWKLLCKTHNIGHQSLSVFRFAFVFSVAGSIYHQALKRPPSTDKLCPLI